VASFLLFLWFSHYLRTRIHYLYWNVTWRYYFWFVWIKPVSWLQYPSSCSSRIIFVFESSVNWSQITRTASFLAAIPHHTTCFELPFFFFLAFAACYCALWASLLWPVWDRAVSLPSRFGGWWAEVVLIQPLRATCTTSTFLGEHVSSTFLRTSFEYEQPRACLWNENMSLKPKGEVSRVMPSKSTSVTAALDHAHSTLCSNCR
jgi:hypothetical protein